MPAGVAPDIEDDEVGDEVVALADSIAERAHAGQNDLQGLPYITHPKAVAKLVAHRGPCAVAVALLHDVLEDTDWTAEMLLAEGMPRRVVNVVVVLTRPRSQPYEEYLGTVIATGGMAVVVKWGDVCHHLSRLHQISDVEQREGFARKYQPALLRLEAALDA